MFIFLWQNEGIYHFPSLIKKCTCCAIVEAISDVTRVGKMSRLNTNWQLDNLVLCECFCNDIYVNFIASPQRFEIKRCYNSMLKFVLPCISLYCTRKIKELLKWNWQIIIYFFFLFFQHFSHLLLALDMPWLLQ